MKPCPDRFIRYLCAAFASLVLMLAPAAVFAQKDSADKVDEVNVQYWQLEPRPLDGDGRLQVQGQGNLTLAFRADEAKCRGEYGSRWFALCNRSTGKSGTVAEGITMEPPLAGRWIWRGDRSLRFDIEGTWTPGQEYAVTIPQAVLPAGTYLDHAIQVIAQPVNARIQAAFRHDPHETEIMAIIGSIVFNYPMDTASVEERFRALVQEGDHETLLGKAVLAWDKPDHSHTLRFSIPVHNLAPQRSEVRLVLEPGASAVSGGERHQGESLTIALPDRNELLHLTRAETVSVTRPDLRGGQLLALEFTHPVLPAEVQDALRVWLLPRDRNANERQSAPHAWWSRTEITPEVMDRAQAITLVPEHGERAMLISFALEQEVEQGRFLLVALNKDVETESGFSLREDTSFLVPVSGMTEELQIMQQGGILTLGGDATLSLYSRNLESIDYQLFRIRPDHINHFIRENRGNFDYPSVYSYDLYSMAIVERGSVPLERTDARSAQFSALELKPFLQDGQKGLFMVTLEGKRHGMQQTELRRFVLVTDLGLIHKQAADQSGAIFVANLKTGQPVRNAQVQILGRNGLPIYTGQTGTDGMVDFPPLTGLPPEQEPMAFVARLGDDLAFLPYQDYGRNVNYSRFETGGNYFREGLDALIFTQRDLYRPGETAHFGYMVKDSKWSGALADLPLKALIYDARGRQVASHDIRLNADGFGELSHTTELTSPAGQWRLDLLMQSSQGYDMILASQSFRVEEFQPDTLRLRVQTSPESPVGWMRPEAGQTVTVEANLMNLFGAPAIDHGVDLTVNRQPAYFSFRQYGGWRFYDAAPLDRAVSEAMPRQVTDDKGDVTWELPERLLNQASARLRFETEGFTADGGRSVKDFATMLVSPLDYVLGWRSDVSLSYIRQGGQASVDLLAVGPDLEPVALTGLSAEVRDVNYVRSLVANNRGLYEYKTVRRETTMHSTTLDVPVQGGKLDLDLSLSGHKVVLIRTAEEDGSRIIGRIEYTVAGSARPSLGENREPQFSLRLDRADYRPGDNMEVYFTAPYKGAGLITIERERVFAHAWFTGKEGDQVQRIRLPKDLDGRAYVNITYFRASDDGDIFTKPMVAAVAPFTMNMSARDGGVSLKLLPQEATEASSGRGLRALFSRQPEQTVDVIRPGRDCLVEVTAAKPGKAIVYAVDEGILQMTAYRTPNPLQALLGNRALQVQTFQYFDLLMPEYGLMQASLSAFGGGDDAEALAEAGLNPFRRKAEAPAVFWSGVLEVGPQATQVAIPVPSHFNGQLRIMAVYCAVDAVGATETSVKVQAEVVMEPALPLFVAPGDEFEAALTLTDMSGYAPRQGENSGDMGRRILITMDSGAALELLEGPQEEVRLYHARQQTIPLRFRVLDALGEQTVAFRVEPAPGEPGEAVERPMSLSIRPALARTSQTSFGQLRPASGGGYEAHIPAGRSLYPHYARMNASVSPLPLPIVRGLMGYLSEYPYGCTEQLVSKAFPYLALLRYPQFAPQEDRYDGDKVRDFIVTTMNILSSRFYDRQGFGMWPGYSSGDIFIQAYAADFLMTAEEMGIFVPYSLKQRVMAVLREELNATPGSLYDARNRAYAAWVLTRNGDITTNVMATLTAWLDRHEPRWREDILAVFMAGCWKMMKEEEQANRLLQGFKPDSKRWWWSYNHVTQRAFYLTVVASHFPEEMQSTRSRQMLDEVLDWIDRYRYMTITAAQTSRALMAWSSGMEEQEGFGTMEIIPSGEGLAGLLSDPVQENLVVSVTGSPQPDQAFDGFPALTFRSEVPGFWMMEDVGFGRGIAQPVIQGLEVRREMRLPDGSPVTSIQQGDEVIMTIIARNLSGEKLESVAITDLLPGGFEMVVAEGGGAVEARTYTTRRRGEVEMSVVFADRREDRILVFADLEREYQDPRHFVYSYRVRAVNKGTFTLPPVSAEAMYDPTVRAIGTTGTVTVE